MKGRVPADDGGLGGMLQSLLGGAGAGGGDSALLKQTLQTLNCVIAQQQADIRWWRERYVALEEKYECSRRAGEAQGQSGRSRE